MSCELTKEIKQKIVLMENLRGGQLAVIIEQGSSCRGDVGKIVQRSACGKNFIILGCSSMDGNYSNSFSGDSQLKVRIIEPGEQITVRYITPFSM